MSGVDHRSFARVAILFACAGALQFCFLNPQPEPPDRGEPTTGGGPGAGGAAGSGGGVGGAAGGLDPGRDSGTPPPFDAASGADVRADTGLGIDAPEDVLSPDADAPSLDVDDAAGHDAPALDADAPGDEADAPGFDAPGSDIDDATGNPDGQGDALADQNGAGSDIRDASPEPDTAAPIDGASNDTAHDGD